MKKLFALILSMLMVITCTEETAYATEEDTQEKVVLYSTTEEERDRIYEAEIEKIMSDLNKNNQARGPKYHYKSENLPSVDKIVGGLAGNQEERGYRIEVGGSLYYSDSGGPAITGSVALSLPSPYNRVSFSINLGVRSEGIGMAINVPNGKDFFKIWIDKTVEIRPYIVYRKRSGMDGEWEIDHCGSVPVVVAISATLIKVPQ